MTSNFRVIAATNRPIQQSLAENRLRSDLYYDSTLFRSRFRRCVAQTRYSTLVGSFVKRFARN